MHQSTTISLTSQKIKSLVSDGSFTEALSLFSSSPIHHHHQQQLLTPSLLPSLLKACSTISFLPLALQLHSFILKSNLTTHSPTLNSLISTYSSHCLLLSAHQLFDEIPHTLKNDPITFNTIIRSLSAHKIPLKSISPVLKQMLSSSLIPNPNLLAELVSSRPSLAESIHAFATVTSTLHTSPLLPTSLIHAYSKIGDLNSSFQLFRSMRVRNVVTWTSIIGGYIDNKKYNVSIHLLQRMVSDNVQPNRATIATVLPACAELGLLRLGKEIHGFVVRHELSSEPRVMSGLITMYSKLPRGIRPALLVFERAEDISRDTITWSAVMAAASRCGDSIRTFEIFSRMRRDEVEPNSVTMLAVVEACIRLQLVDHGPAVLGFILKSGFMSDVAVGNSLIDMFARCGCIESSARVFFELMPVQDSVSYSSMIRGYGIHGRGRDALNLFDEMQDKGFECDSIAILAALSACNHSGLVAEGRGIFEGVKGGMSMEQYACYVDLLARCGRVEEACEVVRKINMRPSSRILSSLVSACRVHGKLEMAEELASELIDMEPENAAHYTLLSAIYADSGNWRGVEEIRRVLRERALRKNLGSSRIE